MVFRVKTRVILEGLHIAWEKGYRQLEIECDNVLLVESFFAGNTANNDVVELRLINEYLNRDWKIRCRHIPRSQNMAIDRMAKCVYDNSLRLTLFEDPLISIKEILQLKTDFLNRII